MSDNPDKTSESAGLQRLRPWQTLTAYLLLNASLVLGVKVGRDAWPDFKARHDNPVFTELGGYKTVAEAHLSQDQQKILAIQNPEMDNDGKHHGELDAVVAASFGKSDPGAQRMQAWSAMLDTVRQIDNPYIQVDAVHHWVRTAIDYDDIKQKKGATNPSAWVQTPQETLRLGTGICGDQAVLAAEALVRVGFDRKDVAIVDLMRYGDDGQTGPGKVADGGHAVAAVRVEDRIMILDPRDAQQLVSADQYFSRNYFQGTFHQAPTFVKDLDGRLEGVFGSVDGRANVKPSTFTIDASLQDRDLMRTIEGMAKAAGLIAKEHPVQSGDTPVVTAPSRGTPRTSAGMF